MNKTIVVVGASRGIGKALVELLAKNKEFIIYALSRNIEQLTANFKGCKNVISAKFDLEHSVEQQLQTIFSDKPQIDILINNAGWLVNKSFEKITHEEFTKSYQINVIGVMETCQFFLPLMKKGHIVNISSMGGFQGSLKFPGLAAYSSSKAALCNFTELFAEEYKNTGLRINCLCLGSVQTEMLEEAFPGYKAVVSPKEMAIYIIDFALTKSAWMNGKIIPVSLTTP